MIAFADLARRLANAPNAEAGRAWVRHYLETTPDPDRGWALAAIVGRLDLPAAGPALLRTLAAARCEPTLFALSREYVGDLGETLALMWPAPESGPAPRLAEVVVGLRAMPKRDWSAMVASWLDACGPFARVILLRLVTGRLRPDADFATVKAALADLSEGRVRIGDIEAVWHTLAPPYEALFAWLEGGAARPQLDGQLLFVAPMLAHGLDEAAAARVSPDEFVAEWLWDGRRAQLQAGPQPVLLSREGLDIGRDFPALLAVSDEAAVLDGMILGDGGDARMRLHDILFQGGVDLRTLALDERRRRLEAWMARERLAGAELSPLIAWRADGLAMLREEARAVGALGVIVKRRSAPYSGGRVADAWWKWKAAPIRVAAVLMYVEADTITAGVWDGGRLVPLGRAENRLGGAERTYLEAWVREHARAKFGPVLEVEASLVLLIECDLVVASPRRRAGIALRAPRVVGVCHDTDPNAAAALADLGRWIRPGT